MRPKTLSKVPLFEVCLVDPRVPGLGVRSQTKVLSLSFPGPISSASTQLLSTVSEPQVPNL